MKTCPRCNKQFENEMSFCLEDGTPLIASGGFAQQEVITEKYDLSVPTESNKPQIISSGGFHPSDSEQETVVLGHVEPTKQIDSSAALNNSQPKSSNSGILLGAFLGIGLVLIGSVFGAVIWYFNTSKSLDMAATNTNQTSAVSANSLERISENANTTIEPDEISQETNSKQSATVSETATPKPSTSPPKPEEPTLALKTPEAKPKPTIEDDEPPPVPTREPRERPSKPISGGVVNGKAISLPAPAYPAAARAVGAKGSVSVSVLIDENGNVMRASAVSGHPLLRNASEKAAREARFRPTELRGQPVKVTGVIVYNFN